MHHCQYKGLYLCLFLFYHWILFTKKNIHSYQSTIPKLPQVAGMYRNRLCTLISHASRQMVEEYSGLLLIPDPLDHFSHKCSDATSIFRPWEMKFCFLLPFWKSFIFLFHFKTSSLLYVLFHLSNALSVWQLSTFNNRNLYFGHRKKCISTASFVAHIGQAITLQHNKHRVFLSYCSDLKYPQPNGFVTVDSIHKHMKKLKSQWLGPEETQQVTCPPSILFYLIVLANSSFLMLFSPPPPPDSEENQNHCQCNIRKNWLQIAINVMNAEDKVLEGKKNIPGDMAHIFSRDDE